MSTVREIAEYAGVSKSTVSLVLRDKPGVSDEMRQVVLNAVYELDSMHASSIIPERTPFDPVTEIKQINSVMVIHPPVLPSSDVFSEVLRGIRSMTDLHNLQLHLVSNDPDLTTGHISNIYLDHDDLRPDGAVMFGSRRHEPLLDKIVARDIPCVVLGREAKRYDVSGIERNETRYAYQLTQHLLECGHRSIVFAGGDRDYDFTRTRITGYQLAMEDAGYVPQDSQICTGDGAEATRRLLATHPETTAIIYINDSHAADGMTVLEATGKAIPHDIAVASFDNTRFAQDYTVPLTSIAYNHYKEGQWAIKMLIEQIRYPFIDQSHLSFSGELIVRGSTGLPPST